MGATSWTEEEDDLIRRCAGQGQSTREAAELLNELFGTERTKMAVVGRANRKGIAFQGQVEHQRRVAAAAQTTKVPKPPRPKTEAATTVANIMRKRAQLRVEQERAQPAETLATLLVMEEKTAAAAGDNPGVLFLDRTMLQCAWPQVGWDAAPIQEKRFCGKPVAMRAGPHGAEPLSWCRDCRKLAYYPAQPRKLDPKFISRFDRSVRAA